MFITLPLVTLAINNIWQGIGGEKGKQPQQQQTFFQKYVRDSEASMFVMDVKKLRHTSNRLLYINKQILL